MKRLLILVFFISCTSHAAGIKKWTDDQGQVHYGDNPPAKVPSESIRVSRPPSDPGKPLPRFSDSQAEEETAAAGQPAQQQAPETTEEQAQAICLQAKEDLVKLRRSSRIRIKSDDGSVRYMSADEIAQRKQQSEEDIEQFCKE